MTTQLQLVGPVETVEFCGMVFPVAQRDPNGQPWVQATEAARVLGLESRDGVNACKGVPSSARVLLPSSTPGGIQARICVSMEGLLIMAARRKGGIGAEVVKALVGFTQAASAASATAPAAPSLSSEQRTDLRIQTAFLNAEARAMREKRLASGISTARLELRTGPAPEGLRDRIICLLYTSDAADDAPRV